MNYEALYPQLRTQFMYGFFWLSFGMVLLIIGLIMAPKEIKALFAENEKLKKWMVILVEGLLICFFCAVSVNWTKYLMDFKHIRNNDYSSGTFIYLTESSTELAGTSLIFENDEGIKVTVSKTEKPYPFTEGNAYEILYLPNTKIGVVIRKIE